jgi:hypothetical protein
MAECRLRLGRIFQAIRQFVFRVKANEAAVRTRQGEREQPNPEATTSTKCSSVRSDAVENDERVGIAEIAPLGSVAAGALEPRAARLEGASGGFMAQPRPVRLHYLQEPKAPWFSLLGRRRRAALIRELARGGPAS